METKIYINIKMDDNIKQCDEEKEKYDREIKKEKKWWNEFKCKITDNFQIILGSISLIVNIFLMVNLVVYKNRCSQYYGIDRRYFNDINNIREKFLVLFIMILLVFLLPYLCRYVLISDGNRIYKITSSVTIGSFIYIQCYLVSNYFNLSWYVNIIVFLFILALIMCCIIKPNCINIIDCIFLCISIILCFFCIYSQLKLGIIENKVYEIINNNKVIITEYKGKYIVCDCRIDNDNNELYISRGDYSIISMNDVKIKYKRFNKAYCLDMGHNIKKVDIIDNSSIKVIFFCGTTKVFDIKTIYEERKGFKEIERDRDFFEKYNINEDGSKVYWDDSLFLDSSLLWEKGKVVM